jgi:O-antigen/teichoic acid export membrane protein
LAILAKPLVTILFGVAYKDLIKVLPMFGLLFYLRFLAGAWGVVLTASGQQTYRMWAGMFHWVVIAIATWVWLPDLGMSGWLLSLCIGNIFLALAYALRVQDQGVRVWQMLVPALAGSILFFPFLDIR